MDLKTKLALALVSACLLSMGALGAFTWVWARGMFLEDAERRLEARAERDHVSASVMAAANLVSGRHDRALDWLERAYDEHAWSLIFLRRRIYDPLRSEPRFRELYRKVGLDSAFIPPRTGPVFEGS